MSGKSGKVMKKGTYTTGLLLRQITGGRYWWWLAPASITDLPSEYFGH